MKKANDRRYFEGSTPDKEFKLDKLPAKIRPSEKEVVFLIGVADTIVHRHDRDGTGMILNLSVDALNYSLIQSLGFFGKRRLKKHLLSCINQAMDALKTGRPSKAYAFLLECAKRIDKNADPQSQSVGEMIECLQKDMTSQMEIADDYIKELSESSEICPTITSLIKMSSFVEMLGQSIGMFLSLADWVYPRWSTDLSFEEDDFFGDMVAKKAAEQIDDLDNGSIMSQWEAEFKKENPNEPDK
jgi:hypothetical protein